jgi:transcriptional regulator NrdR family protein
MERYIGNYFFALIKNQEHIFNKYLEYLKFTDEYYFESAFQTINVNLSEDELHEFIEQAEERLKTVQTDEYCYHELAEILTEYYQNKDKVKYLELKLKYKEFLEDD